MLASIVNNFKKIRDKIFRCFSFRRHATMELIDALSGNISATSVVALSENLVFTRGYGSIHDAIHQFHQDPEQQSRIEECLLEQCSSITQTRAFRLMVVDCTSAPRPHAKTLEDRSVVYAPNQILDNKPITFGHRYSVFGFLPESQNDISVPWILPLSVKRVSTETNAISVGVEQMQSIADYFKDDLVVVLGDTHYSHPRFIYNTISNKNCVLISRLRSNRVLYRKGSGEYPHVGDRRSRGHALWYGQKFDLSVPGTWGIPVDEVEASFITRKGKMHRVRIECWDGLVMRQKQGIPMHECSLRVLRIEIINTDNGKVFNKAMWLVCAGERSSEIDLLQIWQSYRQRYDIEHFFKFGKLRLLLDKFQTPDVKHEESWWQLSCLSYAQLFMARELASNMPSPWEKYLPAIQKNETVKSARQVQKCFSRITKETGTPAEHSKPRGKQLGRLKGIMQTRRPRHPIIVKGKKQQKEKLLV